jgi:hypothetical protein
MYKMLTQHEITGEPIPAIKRLSDNAFIQFDPANTDYAEFKKAVTAGKAELQDADGNTMSSEAAQTFVRGLP